jgi:hypothetical protein
MKTSSFRAGSSPLDSTTLPRSMVDLVRQASSKTVSRAIILAAAAWAPLALLCAIQGVASIKSFLTDFGVQSRCLLVIPLMILAEPPLRARLVFVARHFAEERLISKDEQTRFDSALATSERLRDSKLARILIAVVAYCFTLGLVVPMLSPAGSMSWSVGIEGWRSLSVAGTWAVLVSAPILLYLQLLWIWRQLLWTWFLHCASRLKLRLVASHPDHVGGLGFLSNSLRGQIPFSFAIGMSAAGGVANRVIHRGQSPLEFKLVLVVVIVTVVILCVGPLCSFFGVLLRLKRQGLIAYGSLATAMGHQFEAKWAQTDKVTQDSLGVQDFSATTDLYSVVANVHGLRPFPFGVHDVSSIIVASLVPGLPIVLSVVPFDVIVKEVLKLAL